jgi:hypothetical protein
MYEALNRNAYIGVAIVVATIAVGVVVRVGVGGTRAIVTGTVVIALQIRLEKAVTYTQQSGNTWLFVPEEVTVYPSELAPEPELEPEPELDEEPSGIVMFSRY